MGLAYPTNTPFSPSWSPPAGLSKPVPANDNFQMPANDNFPPRQPRSGLVRNIRANIPWFRLLDFLLSRFNPKPVMPGGWVTIWEAPSTHPTQRFNRWFDNVGPTWFSANDPPPAFPQPAKWGSVAGLDQQGSSSGGFTLATACGAMLVQSYYGPWAQNIAELQRPALAPESANPPRRGAYDPYVIAPPWPDQLPFPWVGLLPKPGDGDVNFPFPRPIMPDAGQPGAPREGFTGGQPGRPSTGTVPGSVTLGEPVTTPVSVPYPPRQPPGPGVKERKVHTNINGSTLGKILNAITESVDAENAFWDALPPQYRSKLPKAYRDKNAPKGFTPDGLDSRVAFIKARDIYRHADKIDMQKALRNVLLNQLSDYASGRLSQAISKAYRRNVRKGWAHSRPVGPQSGPGL